MTAGSGKRHGWFAGLPVYRSAGWRVCGSAGLRGFILFSVLCFLVSVLGCEAFARKFTRKPSKKGAPESEMVVAPQQYAGEKISKENLLYQYYAFWKTWHEELINALAGNAGRKRQFVCLGEAVNNMKEMRALVIKNKQESLQRFQSEMESMRSAMEQDPYGQSNDHYLRRAQRLRRQMLDEFPYSLLGTYVMP